MKIKLFALLYITLNLGTLLAFGQNKEIVALIEAIQANDLARVESLLNEPSFNLNAIDNDKNTVFHHAAIKGQAAIMQLLLRKRIDDFTFKKKKKGLTTLNPTNTWEETPLYLAAKNGHIDCVILLHEAGADLQHSNWANKTPLHIAAKKGHFNILRYLISQEADLIVHDSAMRSPLETAFENLKPQEIIDLLNLETVLSRLLQLRNDEQFILWNALKRRIYKNSEINLAIEKFLNITSFNPANFQFSSDKGEYNEWHLCELLEQHGVEALRAHIGNKTLIGIVTVKGLFYDKIINAVNYYQNTHQDLIIFGYATNALIEALGLESFDGFIIPGADDNYPRHLEKFTIKDMPLEQQTPTEQLYQKICTDALAAQIPTFGICAGAQHLVLNRGGALKPLSPQYKPITFRPFHILHFMCLNEIQRQSVLTHGTEIQILLYVTCVYNYAAVPEHLEDLTLISTDAYGTPMAYHHKLDCFGTQFHPEAYYICDNENSMPENKKYQTQLLNSFFELCRQHNAFMRWAKKRGLSRMEALDKRNQTNAPLLQRLQALRENLLDALQISWTGGVNFLELVPDEEEALPETIPHVLETQSPPNSTQTTTSTTNLSHPPSWGGLQASA